MSVHYFISADPVPYPQALKVMEHLALDIYQGSATENLWFLEHPSLYTAGTSARSQGILAPGTLPVFETGRGGQITYHGPGQRIVYLMLDLRQRGQDLRKYVVLLEEWIIRALSCFHVTAERRPGRIGIWVPLPNGKEAKIAAIGIRIQKWITLHGLAINVCPNLDYFSGIVPCGIQEHGVTSLQELGLKVSLEEIDEALMKTFADLFGSKLLPSP